SRAGWTGKLARLGERLRGRHEDDHAERDEGRHRLHRGVHVAVQDLRLVHRGRRGPHRGLGGCRLHRLEALGRRGVAAEHAGGDRPSFRFVSSAAHYAAFQYSWITEHANPVAWIGSAVRSSPSRPTRAGAGTWRNARRARGWEGLTQG